MKKNSILKITLRKSLIIIMGLFSINSLAYHCPLQSINSLKNKYQDTDSYQIRERFEIKKEIRNLYIDYSNTITNEYINGDLNKKKFKTCLESIDENELNYQVSNQLKKALLSSLKQTHSPILQDLLNDLNSEGSALLIGVKLDLKIRKNERPATYHRTAKNINISIPKIGFNEAKLILIHELVHKRDQKQIYEASINFSNIDTQMNLLDISKTHNELKGLTEIETKELNTYILNGLKRGFLAEFKAWALTYQIYLSLISKGEIIPIQWADQILDQYDRKTNYLDFIFNYYLRRFSTPSSKGNNIFSTTLMQNAYKEYISQLKMKDKCLLVDELKVYFPQCNHLPD